MKRIWRSMERVGKERVIVYVDGFNFYYGLRRAQDWKAFYWLDLVRFFEEFMTDGQELVAVKYFSSRPANQPKSDNQDSFLLPILRIPSSV